MRLKKLEREQVRMKYGGRCAYCGIELGSRWHADHLEPVTRELISKRNANGTWRLDSGKPLNPENDHIGNMMPACAPCNISKGGQSLEGWRTWIARHVNSLNLYQPTYRLAKAYGLIVETAVPVVFHYEKVQTSACGYTHGDWECREGGYLWYAGDGEGYDPSDCTHICPHCRTTDYLEAAKEEAEGCSSWSNNGTSGTGVDLWVLAERQALGANESAARAALAEIGPVHALDGDDSPGGYSVVVCNSQRVKP